ncbi:MAG TPA: DUF2232 domain-containing protein [Thermoanaerobaculia bacterium]|nr:DUF2232 domain-containing protein [Thermoanaerobaculia bacterium]
MIETTTGFEPVTVARQGRGRFARSIMLHSLLAALLYVPPLQLFIPTPFFDAGLRWGRKGAWGAVLGAAALLGLIAAMLREPATGIVTVVASVIFEIGIPAVFATELIRKRVPFGTVLMFSILSSVLGFLSIELVMRSAFGISPYAAVVRSFQEGSKETVEFYRTSHLIPEEQLQTMQRLSTTIATSYVGLMRVVITATMFLFSLVLVPRLPAGQVTGDTYLLRNLSLPDPLLFGFVLGGLSLLAPEPWRTIGLNVLGVVVFLYWLQGLAIFRAILARTKTGVFGTIFAFVMVAVLTPYLIAPFILFLTGLFDPFFDFRHFNRKDDSDESDID